MLVRQSRPWLPGIMATGERSRHDGLGQHFLEVHGVGLDLNKKEDLANCLQNFQLQIMGSVRPPATPEEEPACQIRLDRLEADLQKRLRCMKENGGMNIRDESKRRRRT